jgi:hypothetical protein
MDQLKYDFDTLSAAFNIFAARFDRHMESVAEQSARTPSVNLIDQAKAKARADLEARVKERVAELLEPKAIIRPLFRARYVSGNEYLAKVHAEQKQIQANRKKPASKFQKTCDAVRAQFPNMPLGDLYVAARMRLKLKKLKLPKQTPFEHACADAKLLQPHLEGTELFAAARRLLATH